MRMIARATATLLLLLVTGCAPSLIRDYVEGDPQSLRDYALGETEQSVTLHLRQRPTIRVSDSLGGQTVTWRLKDGRTVIGDFDNQGALTEIHFGHDKP